jgi:hypothetical protein
MFIKKNDFATELPAHADSFGNNPLFGCPYHGYPGGHSNLHNFPSG